MILNYKKSESTIRPEAIDTTSSKTTVYLRKNVIGVETEYGVMYEYDEAKLTKAEYKKYLEEIANFDNIKTNKVIESKAKLAEWLEANPMQFIDGKFYNITEEKQSLLNSNLASYERAKAAGINYPLKWNSTGDECVSWKYDELVSLSLAIAAYVAPKVSRQQEIELSIKACKTVEELESVIISYD